MIVADDLDRELRAARASATALRAEYDRTAEKAEKADQAVKLALGAHHKAKLAAASARTAYSDEPVTKNADAVRKTRDNVELTELACERPRQAAQIASDARAAAATALTAAEQEVHRIEREIRLAELRQVASPADWRARTGDLWDRLGLLLSEAEQVVSQINAEFTTSRTAAVEAGVPAIEGHLWVAEVLRRTAANRPSRLEIIDAQAIVEIAARFTPRQHRPPPVLADVLAVVADADRIGADPRTLAPHEIEAARLALLRGKLAVLADEPVTSAAITAARAVVPGAAILAEPEPVSGFGKILRAVGAR